MYATTPAVVKPARRTASLTLTIKDKGRSTAYGVRPIDPGFAGVKAFRLTKQAGEGDVYDVVQTLDGIRCDCADHVFRREGNSANPCKHGAALVAVGLLD